MDYDVIVIGSGAGGMAAAVPLEQAGLRVLVCEQHEVPGGWTHSFTLGGYRFSPGVHYIGSLGEGETLRRTYEGLGVSGDIAFCELNPAGYDHIVIGEEQFDLPKGRANLISRLKKRFPNEAGGIDGYFDTIKKMSSGLRNLGQVKSLGDAVKAAGSVPPVLKWFRRTGQEIIEEHITDPLLKGILAGQSGDHGLPPSQVSAFWHAGITNHYLNGGYYPLGGSHVIPRAFMRALKRAGGEIKLKTKVEKILLDGKKVGGVKLENGGEISARYVISNADPEVTFGNLIGREVLSNKLLRKVDRVKYSVSALSLFFAVNMDLRAAGLDSGNFWFYENEDVDGLYRLGLTDNALKADTPPMMFLTVTTLKDPSKMHDGHHTCEAFTFVSYDAFKQYEHPVPGVRTPGYQGMKEDMAWCMFKGLENRIPGISEHVTFWDLGTPLTNKHYINATRGSLYGIEKSVTQVGPGAFSTKTEFDGLYMCGASTMSHGVAGATSTGLAAAKTILGCSTSDLLTQNGPPLEIYPSEDTTQWPEYLQKQIERGKKLVVN
jgi:phytoene dehydrogenase-like protein